MKNGKQIFPIDEDEGTGIVASATECTGLMPAAPASAQDAEAYRDICGIPVSGNIGGKSEKARTERRKTRKS